VIDVRVTRDDFARLLKAHSLFTNEEEFALLALRLDPFFSGEISARAVESHFGGEIM
jgi:hypothetical protein